MTVLAFLAALVPIAGSLWAAGWFLVEQAEVRREYRVRMRVAAMVDARRAANGRIRDPQRIDRARRELEEFRALMLRVNGIDPRHGSYTAMDVEAAMTARVVHTGELRRQWLVLGSAVIGLVLLMIEVGG